MGGAVSGKVREMVAAYLLDRADQYETESSSWVGLANAAAAVMNGEIETAARCGELDDPELLRRVRRLKGSHAGNLQ